MGTIQRMEEKRLHPSLVRLYDAAKRFKEAEGESAVARLLNESPQRVHNWGGERGVSKEGALMAQRTIGCDANWVLTGEGDPVVGWPFAKVSAERYFRLEDEDRGFVQAKLEEAISRCEENRPIDPSDALQAAKPARKLTVRRKGARRA